MRRAERLIIYSLCLLVAILVGAFAVAGISDLVLNGLRQHITSTDRVPWDHRSAPWAHRQTLADGFSLQPSIRWVDDQPHAVEVRIAADDPDTPYRKFVLIADALTCDRDVLRLDGGHWLGHDYISEIFRDLPAGVMIQFSNPYLSEVPGDQRTWLLSIPLDDEARALVIDGAEVQIDLAPERDRP